MLLSLHQLHGPQLRSSVSVSRLCLPPPLSWRLAKPVGNLELQRWIVTRFVPSNHLYAIRWVDASRSVRR